MNENESICVNNLNYTYNKSGKRAIKDVSFQINKGEVFGFLGPSGAGKTTTQRLIIGLLENYTGQIKILGKERAHWNKDFYEYIGVFFDFPNLYLKLSAIENLRLIGSYYKNISNNFEELLDKVGLLKDKDEKVINFSKGMKMRLNFVRAIMHNPEIVFLDEPTSGLDPVNAKIIKDTIIDMKSRGKTIFLTTHNMNVAKQLCDEVAFINEGSIACIDKPKNLMIKHGNAYIDLVYFDGLNEISKQFPLKDIGQNPEFNSILKTKKIITIHSQEATLVDVFIKFTGRKLI